jgi:hypothetical protein
MTLLTFVSLTFLALLILAILLHLSTRRFQSLQSVVWFLTGIAAMVATALYVLAGEYLTAAMAFAMYASVFFVGFKKLGQANNTGSILTR